MKPRYIDAGVSEQHLLYIKQVNTPYLDKPYHFHPNCELVYIEEGSGKRIVGDNVDNFSEGDLVLMGPDLPHIWMNDGTFYKGNNMVCSKALVIYFSPKLLDSLLIPEDLQSFRALVNNAKRGIVAKGMTKVSIRNKIELIRKEHGLSQLTIFLSILDEIIQSRELRYLSSEKFVNLYNEKDAGRINEVYRYLMQNFNHDISLDEIASIANMAPTAFCRFFKEHTGKTFTRFLNEIRIQHACDLLIRFDKTITEICYECGYNNMTNFNKFFKGIINKTPSLFKKQFANAKSADSL